MKKRLTDNQLNGLVLLGCFCLFLIVTISTLDLYRHKKPIEVDYSTVEIEIIEEPIEIVQPKTMEELWFEKLAEKYNATLDNIFYVSGHVKYYAKKHNIDYYEVMSLIGVESNYKQNAVSYLGKKYGNSWMQVSDIVRIEYNWMHGTNYTINDLYNTDINLEIGCWYYARLRDHYKIKNEPMYMLSAYNMGPNSKEVNETYVNKVFKNLSLL